MKKGFTLIELLAVIILLSILILLAVTTMAKQTKKGNNSIYESQLETIKLAAKMWGSDNKSLLNQYDNCVTITLGFLKKEGYVEKSIKNTKTGKKFGDTDLYINITPYKKTYHYEVYTEQEKNCNVIDFTNEEDL